MTRCSSQWSVVHNGKAVRHGLSLNDLAVSSAATGFDALRARLSAFDVLAVPPFDMCMALHACVEHARAIAETPESGLSQAGISLFTSIYQIGLTAGFIGAACSFPDDRSDEFGPDEQYDIRIIAVRHGEALRRAMDERGVAQAADWRFDGASAAKRSQPDIGTLFQRLVVIEPQSWTAAGPELLLANCLQQTWRILGAADIALDGEQQIQVLAAYKVGLLQGYVRHGQPKRLDSACGLESRVLTAIAAAGWRHGDMIASRWRTHQEFLAIMFGEGRLC